MSKKRMGLILCPLLLFALLAGLIRAGWTAAFESWFYEAAVSLMSPGMTAAMKAITHLGDPITVTAFCLLLLAIPAARKTAAVPAALTAAVSAGLNWVLKRLFMRERPDILRLITETSFSFPSGHAMTGAALYTMLILLTFRYIKLPRAKAALTGLCVLLPVTIGFSRVYLGVHYAGDILGGWLLGIPLALTIYHIWYAKRA